MIGTFQSTQPSQAVTMAYYDGTKLLSILQTTQPSQAVTVIPTLPEDITTISIHTALAGYDVKVPNRSQRPH